MTEKRNDEVKTAAELAGTIRWDEKGLVPAVLQDAASKDVLTLAYMNKESLERTLATGEAWFWSRSRAELWHKGATSGNVQRVQSIAYDCDADTLLVKAIPQGPACHTGQYSCFYNDIPLAGVTGEAARAPEAPGSRGLEQTAETAGESADGAAGQPTAAGVDRFRMLSVLESIIAKRDAERPEGAYTTYLFEKGLDKILKKVGEETAEVIIAAKNRDNDELRYETSDLIFHMLVLLRNAKLPLDDVMKELDRRHNK